MSKDETKSFQQQNFIRRLLPVHFRIMDLVLAGHGSKVIAEIVNRSAQSVEYVIKSPVFQAELARRRAESSEVEILALDRQATLGKARSILDQASIAAAEKLDELMEADDPAIQLRAASSILDRALGKTGDGGQSPVINISAEQVQLLTLAMKESDDYVRKQNHSPSSADSQDGQEQVHEKASPAA